METIRRGGRVRTVVAVGTKRVTDDSPNGPTYLPVKENAWRRSARPSFCLLGERAVAPPVDPHIALSAVETGVPLVRCDRDLDLVAPNTTLSVLGE
jgi:hypothetical protein